MMQITVPFDKKNDARALGAKVIEGKWCIPNDLSESNKKKLIELFGTKEQKEASVPVAKTEPVVTKSSDFSWDDCFAGSTLLILNALSNFGLPEDLTTRGRLFRRLSRVMPGDYPVTYDGLSCFYPELETAYPKDKIKDALSGFSGDYKKAIEESKLSDDMKGLLLFVLP